MDMPIQQVRPPSLRQVDALERIVYLLEKLVEAANRPKPHTGPG